MPGIRRFLESVRKWTPKPCVLPSNRCLEQFERLTQVIYIGEEAESLAILSKRDEIAIGTSSGQILLVNVKTLQIEQKFIGHKGG